jgi:hypothetical protein
MATACNVRFGGYDKGVIVEGVARAAKKAGSSSLSPSSKSWASTTATQRSFRGGGDKGIAVEGVVRAAKKAGLLLSLPSSESPPAPVGVGIGGVGGVGGVGGARGGGNMGVPQVRPAK